MTTKQRFDNIKDRYLAAFRAANGYDLKSIYLNKGWVWIQSDLTIKNYRVSDIEKMTEVLEKRAENQINKP